MTAWGQTGLLMGQLAGWSSAAAPEHDAVEDLQRGMDHLDHPFLASSFDRNQEARQLVEAFPYQQADNPAALRVRVAAATEAERAAAAALVVAIAAQGVVAAAIAAAEEARRIAESKMAKPERVQVTSLFAHRLDMAQ